MIAVELENLRYAYPNGTIALDGISLTVDADEHVALIGANGAGIEVTATRSKKA